MPRRVLAASLAACLALSPLAASAQSNPPVPEKPAPSLLPQPRTASPAAPPAAASDAPAVRSDASRTPSASAPPDTVQGKGGACVHPPCPGSQ